MPCPFACPGKDLQQIDTTSQLLCLCYAGGQQRRSGLDTGQQRQMSRRRIGIDQQHLLLHRTQGDRQVQRQAAAAHATLAANQSQGRRVREEGALMRRIR